MADTTARTLRLLSLLQARRFWPGSELAERLAVSRRTLRRDVGRLRELGYPVDATPGAAGGYQLATGGDVPPLLLDDDEAVAIAVGLGAAAGAAVVGIEESSVRALAKLEQLLPDRLRRRVTALHANVAVLRGPASSPEVDPDVLALLAQLCRDAEEARFDYRRRDGEDSSRLVRPHHLVAVGRRWYLVAWDVRRDDWRTFRIDRIRDARAAGVRFVPLQVPGGDPARFVTATLRATPTPHRATVGVRASAEELREVLRWFDTDAVDGPDGWCEVELRAESEVSLASMVATIAVLHDVRIDGADELCRLLEATAGRLRRCRRSGRPTPGTRTGTDRDES